MTQDKIWELLPPDGDPSKPTVETIAPENLPEGAVPVKPVFFSNHVEKKKEALNLPPGVEVVEPIIREPLGPAKFEPLPVKIPKVSVKISRSAATSLIHSAIESVLGDHTNPDASEYADPPFKNFAEISGTLLGSASKDGDIVVFNIDHAYTDKFSSYDKRKSFIIPHTYKEAKSFYSGMFVSKCELDSDGYICDDPEFEYVGNFHTHFNYHFSSREYKEIMIDGKQHIARPYIFEHVFSNGDLDGAQTLYNEYTTRWVMVDQLNMGDIEIVISISHNSNPYFKEHKKERLESNILKFISPTTGLIIWIAVYYNMYLNIH